MKKGYRGKPSKRLTIGDGLNFISHGKAPFPTQRMPSFPNRNKVIYE